MAIGRFFYCSVFACSALTVGFVCQAKDWPTFRGADRTAISDEANFLDSWGPEGPKLVWEAKGAGEGYSSISISAGRLYTTGDGPSTAPDKDEYLTCYDEKDGHQIWMSKIGTPWNDRGSPERSGSRGTPSVDGDRVYAITPDGIIACCKTSDGSPIWKKDFKADFNGKKRDQWGYSESPLVDGERIICTPGGTTSTVVALNKHTGELIWKCVHPGDVGAGHSSVVISEVGGQRVYVQNTGGGAIGIAAATGKLLWENPVPPPTAFNPSPIIKGDLVYSIAGYSSGATLLRQVPGNDGSVSIQEIYPIKSTMKSKHGGVVLVGDYIYGGHDDRNLLFCANMMTGEQKWQAGATGNPEQRGPGNGSVSTIAAGNNLIMRYQDGTITLVRADPKEYVELGKFKTPPNPKNHPCWANPSVANGKLYIRQDDMIYCYSIAL